MEPGAPLDRDEFDRWREEATRALSSARLQEEAGLHNWACFAAEQAAQLALKALLHGAGAGPWGHDLVRLGEAASNAGFLLPDPVVAALRRLARHYIPSRYPDAHPGGSPGERYGVTDARDAIADSRIVLEFVDETWAALNE
jgi:HEPN domain-containing protein